MNKRVQPILLKPSTCIKEAMRTMEEGKYKNPPAPAGIGLVVDKKGRLLGVVTDGDIRRAILKDMSTADPVSIIMAKNPLRIVNTSSPKDMLVKLYYEIKKRNAPEDKYHHIVVVDEHDTVEDVVTPFELWRRSEVRVKNVAIIGLGYVGLTLALSLNELGIKVFGIDTDNKVIGKIESGAAHFYEKGLDVLLQKHIHKDLFVKTNLAKNESDIYVICVGTATDGKNRIMLAPLKKAARAVGRALKTQDLVILRSTVVIGTCRRIVIPILEKESGMKAGRDFFVAFAPERTVEGRALEELRTLPQIIGAYNKQSLDATAQLFQPLASTIVTVSSLEAAEAIKLLNNSFRDISFSFANEVSQICNGFGLNTIEVIRAANEGYPRDRIPYPSPGVGGSCLVKDPYILIESARKVRYAAQLPIVARAINKGMIDFVYKKVHAFCVKNKKDPARVKIFLMGMAFKGEPETSDIRASTSVEILKKLQVKYKHIVVYDPIAKKEELQGLGTRVTSSPTQGCRGADCVLVLTNHRSFRDLDVYGLAKSMNSPGFFFDGWSIFTKNEFASLKHIIYESI